MRPLKQHHAYLQECVCYLGKSIHFYITLPLTIILIPANTLEITSTVTVGNYESYISILAYTREAIHAYPSKI